MISRRQHEALQFINDYMRDHHISPTYEEIAAGIGLAAKSGVHRLLGHLKDHGYIDWSYSGKRCLSVLKMPGMEEMPVSKEVELEARLERLERRIVELENVASVIPLRGSVR